MSAINHVGINAIEEVESICKPLHIFYIMHFTYLRNYHNGEKIHLSTSGQWLNAYYRKKFYTSSIFEQYSGSYTNGYVLWHDYSNHEVFSYARDVINSDHGITLIMNNRTFCEFYFFSTFVDNPQIINFYLNNLSMLKRFTLYFKGKANHILQEAIGQKIVIPELIERRHRENASPQKQNTIQRMLTVSNKQMARFQSETPLKNMTLISESGNEVAITPREFECAIYLFQGKSNDRIARLMNISPRTAGTHIQNMRIKLECYNKKQFMGLLEKNNLSQYLDILT